MLKDTRLLYIVSALVCALTFGLLTLPIALGWPIPGDESLLSFAMSLRNNWLSFVIQLMTFAASFVPSVLICGAVALVELWRARRLRLGAGWALIALAGFTVCNIVIRQWVGRLPPAGGYIGNLLPELWSGWQEYAYPSGHAGTVIITMPAVALLLWPYVRFRRPVAAVAGLIILGAGLGRVYLGVHWPTDVLGGYLLGGVWLLVGLLVRQRYNA